MIVLVCAWLAFIVGCGVYQHTVFTFCTLAFIIILIVTVFSYMDRRHNRQVANEPKTLVGKWMKANKSKVCPLVQFTSFGE